MTRIGAVITGLLLGAGIVFGIGFKLAELLLKMLGMEI